MRIRLAVLTGVATIAIGAGFVAVSGQTAPRAAASMVVYKSST